MIQATLFDAEHVTRLEMCQHLEVAFRLGTVRELVSRSLSQLRAAGLIVVHGRRVRLSDER